MQILNQDNICVIIAEDNKKPQWVSGPPGHKRRIEAIANKSVFYAPQFVNFAIEAHLFMNTTSAVPYELERTRKIYKKHWPLLIQVFGRTCYYCGEFATQIDHLMPISAGGSSSFDNLVPCCAPCNLTGSDHVFETIEDKTEYILKKRRRKGKRTLCLCSDCLMPYEYLVTSPSLLLCARCYDYDLGIIKWTKRKLWANWLDLLVTAGYDIEAYAELSRIVCTTYDKGIIIKREVKMQLLSNLMMGYTADGQSER